MLVKGEPGHATGGVNGDGTVNLPTKLGRNPAQQGVSILLPFQFDNCNPGVPSWDAVRINVAIGQWGADTIKEGITPSQQQQSQGIDEAGLNFPHRLALKDRRLFRQIIGKGFYHASREGGVA